jgi:ABC-type phosphate/phosphonate transport system ATPase subunit
MDKQVKIVFLHGSIFYKYKANKSTLLEKLFKVKSLSNVTLKYKLQRKSQQIEKIQKCIGYVFWAKSLMDKESAFE